MIDQVRGYHYSKVKNTPVKNPKFVSVSKSALEILDLDSNQILNDPEQAEYLCGNKTTESMRVLYFPWLYIKNFQSPNSSWKNIGILLGLGAKTRVPK